MGFWGFGVLVPWVVVGYVVLVARGLRAACASPAESVVEPVVVVVLAVVVVISR